MAVKDGPGSERIEGNFRLVRGLILVALTLTSLVILATFNRRITSKPTPPHASAPNSTSTVAVSAAKAVMRFVDLPLDFEVNRGQVDAVAKYVARAPGYSLFVTGDGAVLSMERFPERINEMAQQPKEMASRVERHVLRMNLVGGDPLARIDGVDPNSAISDYFPGPDQSKWRTRIPHFNKVRESSVYRGIDLVYYGANRQLEYDFVVHPQADPSRIQMHFGGADQLLLDPQGNIAMKVGHGRVVLHKPVIYQVVEGKRHPIEGGYQLKGDTVSIQVASYDRALPLVIDPKLGYATYLGGSVADGAASIAADSSLNAYLTGVTCSPNFPNTTAVQNGGCSAFVTEINPTGTSLVYSALFPATGTFSTGTGIAVDGSGAAYVVGAAGANFPTKAGGFKTSLANEERSNAFVLKLAPAGATMVYSTYLGGKSPAGVYPLMDTGLTIALLPGCASNCNAYVGGSTDSSNFPTAPIGGALQGSNGGTTDPFDGFVTEMSTDGSSLVYSTYLGGASGDVVLGIAVDTSGAAYVTGGTDASQGAHFPVKNSLQAFGGTADAYIAKINSAGTSTVYATYLGGSGYDTGLGIAVDTAGNAYISGLTYSSDFPTIGGVQNIFGGGAKFGKENGFIAKLNSAGSMFNYVTYLGGISAGMLGGPVVDAAGNAYVTGFTDTPDFPVINQLAGPSTGSGEVFASTDGTANFKSTALSSSANTLAVDFGAIPSTIYAATVSAGVLKSTDDGATFKPTGLNSGYTSGLLIMDQPAAVFVGTLNGLMKSTNGGATFSVTGGLGSNPVFPLLVNTQTNAILVATGANGVAVSTDGAMTFTASTLPAHTEAYSAAIDFASGKLFLGTNHGILVSTDQGMTFATTMVNFDAIFALYPQSGEVFAGGQNNEVIESTDGFNTYSFPASLGPNSGPGYGFEAHSDGVQQLFAATDNGLFVSSDNGASFSNFFALGGINSSPFVGPFEFNTISLDFDKNPPIIFGAYTQKDAVIAELNPLGNELVFSTYLGGTMADFGQGIALAPNNSALYVDGTTASSDFPATSGSLQPTARGTANAFVAQILLPTPTSTATSTATATTTATATATSTGTATATATATSTATATATASHTATATASASATRTATPTATATSSATATATATLTATAVATPTVTVTATIIPTVTMTILPTPTATASPPTGGNIVVATPVVNVIGKAGATIGAGSFTYTNTEVETTEHLSSVTITVTKPEILSSLTLTATFNETNQSVTASPPTSTTVFTFDSPLVVPAGTTVNFSLNSVIAGGAAASGSPRRSIVLFNTNSLGGGNGGGGGSGGHLSIQSPMTMLRDAASGHSFLMVASAIIPTLLMMLVLPAGIRPRVIAASAGLVLTTMTMSMTMTGCDPCPACTTAKLKTTDQYVAGVAVTDVQGNQLGVTGVPTLLSQLSK